MNIIKSMLCATLLSGATLPAAWAADNDTDGIITVSGSAALDVAADLAELSFGVETEAAAAADALAANSGLMTTVVEAIQAQGIAEHEISTAQFNVSPIYDREQERPGAPIRQVLRGYRVSNLLNVSTADLEKVAQVVDAAVAAGANRVDRIHFGLSAERAERSRKQLIERAVNDARDKARLALEPLRYQITGVKTVAISERAQPGPMFAESMRMDAAVAAAPPVFAGDQGVTLSVNVTFTIGPR